MPEVTVLTTVYNALPYLPMAVDSILGQTLSDFRFLIIDDGSTDGSAAWLDNVSDERICVVHQANCGLAGALNRGLALCETPFVARFDADDYALPTRLEKQLAFLRSQPEVGLVGTQVAPFGDRRVGRNSSLPCEHREIDSALMLGRHALCHSSVMYRTALVREIGGYWSEGLSEDWDLYLRMAERAQLANLDEVLLHYRVLPTGLQGRHAGEVRLRIAYACQCARQRRAGLSVTSYAEFQGQAAAARLWQRLRRAQDDYALWQYRRALPDVLGTRRAAGYARLMWAAACSPPLTWQRLARVARRRFAAWDSRRNAQADRFRLQETVTS